MSIVGRPHRVGANNTGMQLAIAPILPPNIPVVRQRRLRRFEWPQTQAHIQTFVNVFVASMHVLLCGATGNFNDNIIRCSGYDRRTDPVDPGLTYSNVLYLWAHVGLTSFADSIRERAVERARVRLAS